MASLHELHELREPLVQGDYFLSFDDLLEAIRDILYLLSINLAFKHCIKTSNASSKNASVEPPVIQGKSRNVRDVLCCICGIVLDISKYYSGTRF